MRFYKVVMLIVLISGLIACDQSAVTQEKPAEKPAEKVLGKPLTLEIQYLIEEPELKPYLSRVIMTDDFMRIDEGEGSTSFVLYNRRENTVYSVASDNDAILIVKPRELPAKSPIELNDSAREVPDDKVPDIDGKKAVQYFLDTNGVNCYQTYVVPGLLPAAVEVFKNYRRVLAGDHALTMDNVPPEVLEPCDLSMNIFSSSRLYDKGFPVHERGPNGFVKTLKSYNENYQPAAELFVLPKEYGRFTIEDMRKSFGQPDSQSKSGADTPVETLLNDVLKDPVVPAPAE